MCVAKMYSSKVWSMVLTAVKRGTIFLAVLILGVTIRGDWLLAAIHFLEIPRSSKATNTESYPVVDQIKEYFLIWIACNSVSFIMYFGIGGFLHWHYYICRRDEAESWKCQPNRWLSSDLLKDAIYDCCKSLLTGNTFMVALIFYLMNDGWSLMYKNFDDYSIVWWILQWPVIFFTQDYFVYHAHRMYHTPYFYKNYHKVHHKYKQPSPLTVAALHPVEVITTESVMILPMFMFPVHWVPYLGIAFYIFYCSILDHSGIDFKAPWWQPWRPDTIYHDNHHQYFHVNFSFNCRYWDLLHGTHRKPDKIYNENIYYGSGKPLVEATENEIMNEEEERKSENPLAHRNKSDYLLPKQY